MDRESNSSTANYLRTIRSKLATLLILITFYSGFLTAATPEPRLRISQTREKSVPAPAPNKAYGSKNAPITVEVFSDYQCPYCRAFYDNTLRQLIANYVAAGKVYLLHRDFPLAQHKYSGEAARWANACAEVGRFESAETALYDNQDAWGEDGDIARFISAALPVSDFRRVNAIMKESAMPGPQATGASVNPLAGVIHPCPVDPYIAQDIRLGYQAHVNGTPTLVVTYKGRHFTVAASGVSWPILKQFFDSLLQQ